MLAEFDQYFLESVPDTLYPTQIRSAQEVKMKINSDKLYSKTILLI